MYVRCVRLLLGIYFVFGKNQNSFLFRFENLPTISHVHVSTQQQIYVVVGCSSRLGLAVPPQERTRTSTPGTRTPNAASRVLLGTPSAESFVIKRRDEI